MRAKLLLAALVILGAQPALAEDYSKGSQLSVRLGLFSGNFSAGGTSNTQSERLNVPTALDTDYELYSNNSRSFFFRGTLAYDISSARVSYLYFGTGMRFYLMGNAMAYERSDIEGNRVASSPTSRLFIGPDVGLSHVEVQARTTTAVLTLNSTGIDVGAHLGYVKQLSNTFGLEILAGGSFAYGFTTVSASGLAIRAMFGITQYF